MGTWISTPDRTVAARFYGGLAPVTAKGMNTVRLSFVGEFSRFVQQSAVLGWPPAPRDFWTFVSLSKLHFPMPRLLERPKNSQGLVPVGEAFFQ